MRISVPYYSQHLDVADSKWQSRACGVACLKMLLEARSFKTPSLDDMIIEGDRIGAYTEHGWLHDGLISLGSIYGANLYRIEFRRKGADYETSLRLNNEGIEMILQELDAGRPVIVSAIKQFKIHDQYHMVVIVGVEMEKGAVKGFYYHDPDSDTPNGGAYQFVPLAIFRNAWRCMAIFSKK